MGLTLEIYRNSFGDCTNNGITSNHTGVTLVNADGPFEPTAKHPAVMLVKGPLGDPTLVPAVWAAGEWVPEKRVDMCGPMAGGNYAATSDSRFGEAIRKVCGRKMYAALPVHDRFETWAQYDALSR
jgi:hypothetical protein